MPGSRDLRLERVENRRQRADFHRVRWDLYRRDPAAVLTLDRLEWQQLDPRRHPFYEHGRREVWVAYRGRQPVGRIAAIVDDLHQARYGDRTGFFGFFESPDDPEVARLLLARASDWLIEQGCDRIRGPVNPSMKSEFGVLTEGHQHPPYIMMGHSLPYYDRLLTECGLAIAKRFHAFLFDTVADREEALRRFSELDRFCERLNHRFPELTVRLGTSQTLEPMLREINRIGNVIRSRGWGFVPLTEAELAFNVAQLKRVIDPETVIGAYLGDRMVGYNVAIPNVNWALRRCRGRADWVRLPQLLYWLRRIPEIRCIAVGVDPEIRAKGIATLVTKAMTDQWHKYRHWEFGWIAEDNLASMNTLERALPLRRYKTWQVYEGPLPINRPG